MFIETEDTPNPATLKFLPGRYVMEASTADFACARLRPVRAIMSSTNSPFVMASCPPRAGPARAPDGPR